MTKMRKMTEAEQIALVKDEARFEAAFAAWLRGEKPILVPVRRRKAR